MHWCRSALRLAVAASLLGATARGAPSAPAAPGVDMDYGPFLTGSLDRDRAVSEKHSSESTEQTGTNANALATKAVIVRLGTESDPAAIAFDTDLLRYAAGWTGGFVNLDKTHLATLKGSVPLTPNGKLLFASPPVPGWSTDGSFENPVRPFGPLPKSVGRYKGLQRQGNTIVLRYSVGGCDVAESSQGWRTNGRQVFLRTLHVGSRPYPLWLLVCESAPGISVSVARARNDVAVEMRAGLVVVKVPASADDVVFAVHIAEAPGERPKPGEVYPAIPFDPLDHIRPGLPRRPTYPEVITRGRRGSDDSAYTVDALTLPADNPWKSWMRPSGIDFFSDGRIAICTLNGDVWVASGADDKLERLSWRRFATGLYEPLGLKVVKDKVYVLGRDQITRLHDLNDDGEADFYENFNNDAPASANYHGFAMDLCTDSAGNFYYTRAGQRMHPSLPHHGTMIRVSPDGLKLESIASGLRAANGMAVGPDDVITVGDNQGNWMPSSKISVVRPGGFYGYTPHVRAAGGKPRDDFDPPLCWIPITVDNSSGSQVWTTDATSRFGPLSNRLLHTSYGKASLMLVTMQKLDDAKGSYQGGVIPLPLRFDSGVMRGRINPKDGQLYLCGLRGWQTAGAHDGAVARVRYTGKPLYLPTDAKVVAGGIELTFGAALDPETAEDVGSYGVEQWNYRWSADYGSPEFSVKTPGEQGRDEVTVAAAKLRRDRKTVFLSIPDIRPVMQMQIRANVDAADGTAMDHTAYLTIHRVD